MEDIRKINKIYRYEALLQAIDFFTQRFSLDQLGYHAFDFANEILTLHSASLFVRDGNNFVQKSSRLYTNEKHTIPHNQALEELPAFHGDIIINKFENFFSQEVITKFQMRLVIPLLIHDFLYGFIISDGKNIGRLEEDDLIIASSLTKLFRNSLENSNQIDELNRKNKQLDQKIFNLFAINQSAKSLLSEVDLDSLYSLATDVFSELTSSKVTSFGIYNSFSDSIKVLGYRNITTYSKFFTDIYLNKTTYSLHRVVLEIDKDKEIIKSIFKNYEEFELLKAKYIILLVKDKILGVVTLSETVNDSLYDEATFELIEALASFTHVAISNALLFKEIIIQKERAERKFDILNTLNKITSNINRSTSIEELSNLTLKTLSLNFGIKKAFIAYKNQDNYEIQYTLGLKNIKTKIVLNNILEKAVHGEIISDFKEGAIRDYFDNIIIDEIGHSNCVVISPISIQRYFYQESSPMGFLVVLETKDSLKEEEILLIDTISKNISPVIHQMNLNERIRMEYKMDPLKQFVRAIEIKLEERKEYSLDFYLYYKILDKNPFENYEDISMEDQEYYIVDNFVFLVTYNIINDDSFCKMPHFEQIEEVFDFDYKSFYYTYRNNIRKANY